MAKRVSGAITLALTLLLALLVWRGAFLAAGLPAILAQAAALLLMLWARLTMGLRSFHFTANPTRGELVESGPFRYVRHPIYAAAALWTWAGVLSHWSSANGAVGALVTSGLIARVQMEERLLRAHYPGYPGYARRTSRLIPFVY